MKQSDNAIFLHRINYSETSLIATFYTQTHGLQKFMFQGGKKKGTSLFPLSLCEITFYKRPDSELGKLTEARPSEMLIELFSNPMKATLAFFMADVIKQCLQTDQSDPQLFHFLTRSIHALDGAEDLSSFSTEFLIGFSEQLGVEPQIQDKNCAFFHLQDGDFSDFERLGELVATGSGVLFIQTILRGAKSVSESKQTKKEAFEIMLNYFKLHIPRFNVDQSLGIIHDVLYN